MSRHVVTLNAGSSTIKFAVYEADGTPRALAVGLVEMSSTGRHIVVHDGAGAVTHDIAWAPAAGEPFHHDALQRMLAWQRAAFPDAEVAAAGHRVVHGGTRYDAPVLLTDEVLAYLEKLQPLAPLHQPYSIAGILGARVAWPHVRQVACFDTAFHRAHPFVNDVFALPRRYFDAGVRRYGFHGLSYEYVIGRLRETQPLYAQGRVVVAHLGNGASMCAMRDGQSLASSMGFTALDGLPMGTRCGQLDPGVVLYMMAEEKLDARAISDVLYKESGLKGLSGISHDMRELEASDSPHAAEAIEYFVFRIRRELGGLAAVLKGLDAVVFCGGIGEHAWRVRERVLEGMEWIGIELDHAANRDNATVISSERSRVRVFIVPTDEQAMIVRHTLSVLDRQLGRPVA
jgi:acetate kinase